MMLYNKEECHAKLTQAEQLLRIAGEVLREVMVNYNFTQEQADHIEALSDRCKYISGQVMEARKTTR